MKKKDIDFPDGTPDKNLPANAGAMGSVPGLGRFHGMRTEQRCPCATTATASCLEPRSRSKKSRLREKHEHHDEQQPPHTAVRESPPQSRENPVQSRKKRKETRHLAYKIL